MRSSGIRDDVAPWSFFLPVTLAVIVGVLVAGVVERGIDAVFDGDGGEEAAISSTARQEAAPAPQPDSSEPRPAAVPDPESPPVPAASQAPAAPPPVEVAETDGADTSLPSLPGATAARRDGAAEACINGTVALRDDNGWQQRLENDAPVPCVEQSATR